MTECQASNERIYLAATVQLRLRHAETSRAKKMGTGSLFGHQRAGTPAVIFHHPIFPPPIFLPITPFSSRATEMRRALLSGHQRAGTLAAIFHHPIFMPPIFLPLIFSPLFPFFCHQHKTTGPNCNVDRHVVSTVLPVNLVGTTVWAWLASERIKLSGRSVIPFSSSSEAPHSPDAVKARTPCCTQCECSFCTLQPLQGNPQSG